MIDTLMTWAVALAALLCVGWLLGHAIPPETPRQRFVGDRDACEAQAGIRSDARLPAGISEAEGWAQVRKLLAYAQCMEKRGYTVPR
jgi:hypothetical protein